MLKEEERRRHIAIHTDTPTFIVISFHINYLANTNMLAIFIINRLNNILQGAIHVNLEDVYLTFNNIRIIHQHTFVDLESLKQLHLDENRLEKLERRSFMNLNSLTRLNLKGNLILSVAAETFQNLPLLEDLDMSYNRLNKFEFSIFDQVGTLSMFRVNVSHNKIVDLHINVNDFGREPGELFFFFVHFV